MRKLHSDLHSWRDVIFICEGKYTLEDGNTGTE